MDTLGELIRRGREKRKTKNGKSWTQEDLCKAVGKSKQWVSRIETGDRVPSFELLVKLHETLVATVDKEPRTSLVVWFLKWLEEQGQKSRDLNSDEKEVIREAIRSVLEGDIARSCRPTVVRTPEILRSLVDFPCAFEPLTIVCGDRREPSPKTRGDIFAYSGAVTDLMFLLCLRLDRDVKIRSDKLFVVMDDEYLRREFGNTNLLIIGSPAVNFAARIINNYSVFRFDLAPQLKAWAKQFRSLKELDDPRHLEVFWRMAQDPRTIDPAVSRQSPYGSVLKEQEGKKLAGLVHQLLSGDSPKDWMNRFRRPGLVDPADGKVQAEAIRQDNDFGVISLAKNPFASSADYVSILIAGIHGPGTAHAVRAFVEADFNDYPLGGIIEVTLNPFQDWPTRFEQAQWKWQTHPYTLEKVVANLEHGLKEPLVKVFENLTENEIKDCLEFVRSIATASDSNPDT